MKTLHRSCRLLLVAGAGMALTACSNSSAAHPGSLDSQQIHAEYQQELQSLTLPAGRTFPEKSYAKDETYQAGFGRNDADNYWYCSWVSEFLKKDGSEQSAALTQLQSFPKMYVYTHSYDDATRQTADKMISAAALGDPGPLRTDFEVNCRGS